MLTVATIQKITSLLRKFFPSTRTGWLALAFFTVVSIPISIYGQNERSGWNLMTLPVDPGHFTNSLLGYVYTLGSEPIHKENTSFIHQVMLLGGFDGFTGQNFYFLRPVYSFLVSLILPFFGLINSFIIINYIGWATCAWIAWRFTRKLFADELAAFFSVLLVTSGMGFIAHIGDYSAHLLAFTAYYAGILVLYESKVWRERQPFRTHLAIGLFFAIACLTYTSSLALVPAYFLLALPFNSLPSVILSSVVALSSRQIWQFFLNTLGITFVDVEGDYLRTALTGWYTVFFGNGPDHNTVLFTLRRLSEFLSFCHPLIIILLVISLGYLYFSKSGYVSENELTVALLSYLFITPIAAGLVYSTVAPARGYLVYGVSLIAYALVSYLLSRLTRWSLKTIRLNTSRLNVSLALAFTTAASCLIALNFAWSTAHLSGNLFPLKSYYIGYLQGLLASPRMNAISLTGHEVSPKLLGGNSSLLESGLHLSNISVTTSPSKRSFYKAAILRFTILSYLLILILVLRIRAKAKMFWLSLIIFYCLTSLALSQSFVRSISTINNIDAAIQLHASHKLQYKVLLSEELRAKLVSALSENQEAHSLVFWAAIFPIGQLESSSDASLAEIYLNDRKVNGCLVKSVHSPFQLACSGVEGIKLLSKARSLSMEIHSDLPLSIGGWQQVGLKDRSLTIESTDGADPLDAPEVLPTVELRVIDEAGRLIIAGF